MRLETEKNAAIKAAIAFAAIAATVLLLLSACSSSLDVRVSGDAAAFESAAFSAGFSPAAERLAQAFLGQEAVFDRAAIEKAFDTIDFPSPASVRVQGDGDKRLEIEFSRINLDSGIFTTLTDGDTKVFDIDAGEKRLVITLSRETVAKTIAALPAELFEYADLLMAPVLTGESITEEEYLALIGAAYGPQAASELESCSFRLAVQCPAEVVRASAREFAGGALSGSAAPAAGVEAEASGSEARFIIPAAKVFALSYPLQLEVWW